MNSVSSDGDEEDLEVIEADGLEAEKEDVDENEQPEMEPHDL